MNTRNGLARFCVGSSIALLAGCGGGSEFQARDLPLAAVQGDFYGDWPVAQYVIHTQAEWAAAWARHDSWQSPVPDLPQVDFAVNTVVGVTLGWAPDSCYGLRVDGVREEETRITFTYHRTAPGPAALCLGSISPLVAFVAIPATSKPVVFIETQSL